MTAKIDNLMENVFSYFLNLYRQTSGSPTNLTFLAFESIGTQITPNMFKLRATDSDYSAALAVEKFSDLTNTIPAISADLFQRTGKHVDEFYNMLLEGSFPGTEDTNEVTLFSNFKAQATKQRDNMKIGSSVPGKLVQFLPAYATPNDWYDASNVANWQHYSARMDQQQQETEQDPAPRVPPQLAKGGQRWQWQVLPDRLTTILDKPEVVDRISTIDPIDLEAITQPTQAASTQVLKPELESRLTDVLKLDLTANVSPVLQNELQTPMLRAKFDRIPMAGMSTISPNLANQLNVRSVNLDRLKAVRSIETPPIRPPKRSLEDIAISPVIQTTRLSELLKQSSQASVASNNLTLNFTYCLVTIDRPWISQAYLATKGWYVPGYQTGGFSTGNASENAGVFPALPIALILVKDLQISGWSDAETQTVERSAGFGPFSLIGRSFDRTTKNLTCNGMQIIGWICQTMPLLPPASDPIP